MSAGFYKRRRGILEHLEAGNIGLVDLAVHDYLCLKMNAVIGNHCSIPAGVCFTSAAAIYAVCPKEVSERTIRRSLEHLEKIGWIKRWTIPGKHGNYPVMVARASVHDLAGKEYRVSAMQTSDWRFPFYIPCEEAAGSARAGGEEMSADREVKNLEVRGESKAVRRTANDAELRVLPPNPSFKKNQKKERLAAHLAGKIAKDGERLEDWDLGEWKEEIIRTFDAIGYRLNLRSPQLSAAFLITACEVFDENREREITRGNLCSKIIDRCVRVNKEDPDGGYYWPPDFQEHRDRLRQAERAVKLNQLAAVGAA